MSWSGVTPRLGVTSVVTSHVESDITIASDVTVCPPPCPRSRARFYTRLRARRRVPAPQRMRPCCRPEPASGRGRGLARKPRPTPYQRPPRRSPTPRGPAPSEAPPPRHAEGRRWLPPAPGRGFGSRSRPGGGAGPRAGSRDLPAVPPLPPAAAAAPDAGGCRRAPLRRLARRGTGRWPDTRVPSPLPDAGVPAGRGGDAAAAVPGRGGGLRGLERHRLPLRRPAPGGAYGHHPPRAPRHPDHRHEQRLRRLGLLHAPTQDQPFFRLSPAPGPVEDDHVPFLQRGVPVLHLIPTPFPRVWHTLEDTEDNLHPPTVEDLCKILVAFVAEFLQL
ncbi:glutaminyl-peptide cyclotransferase-like protein isoform X6 [Calonectris borealis]|uniref:glutaminyl-peptide cyclotransferase-like protein isoform X6 n=1 Tax=Calonectris borealis TaxID=1323832 RepID=UPI003F4C7C72